jgi:hypothetical protein
VEDEEVEVACRSGPSSFDKSRPGASGLAHRHNGRSRELDPKVRRSQGLGR